MITKEEFLNRKKKHLDELMFRMFAATVADDFIGFLLIYNTYQDVRSHSYESFKNNNLGYTLEIIAQ